MNPIHAMNDHVPPSFDDNDRHTTADVRWTSWQEQSLREQLRGLHADWAHNPTPSQQAAATRLQETLDRQDQWWRWGGMAAGWVLAFGLGWLGHTVWPGLQAHRLEAQAPHTQCLVQHFAQQAAVAHAVFQPELRHPVEVTAEQQEHLVQWLSKRLGHPLKVPALHAQGFELMGGRLLPGDSGARAQFMYQNTAGVRITLYIGVMDKPATAAETAFRFYTDGPVPGFYWVDQGFGYALSGELSRPVLLNLATSVHQQL